MNGLIRFAHNDGTGAVRPPYPFTKGQPPFSKGRNASSGFIVAKILK
jgi:hypothetical protein